MAPAVPVSPADLATDHATDDAHRRSAEAYEASALALFRQPATARRHRLIASEHRGKITGQAREARSGGFARADQVPAL